MTATQFSYIISFDAWILPNQPLCKVAGVIGEIFSVPLLEGFTSRFDEYPAYALEMEETVFIRLMGVPPDLENLLVIFPTEFDEKDRNYALCISCHATLPCTLGNGFVLPYQSPEEFLVGAMNKLRSAGLTICETPRAFVQVGTQTGMTVFRASL